MKTTAIILVIISMFLIAGCSLDSTQHAHSDDELHDHSVEIEGREMKSLTVQQVADLWEIDSTELFDRIIKEFEFTGNYTTETVLDEMRDEYPFSPAIIKDMAEEIKQKGVPNE